MKGIQNTIPVTGMLNQSASNISYVPILQGILDGIGWKSPSIAIYEEQKLESEREFSFQEIEQLYEQSPTATNQKKLLFALDAKIDVAKAELRSAQRHQKEAHTALMKKTTTPSSTASWLGSWFTESVQYAFDSTPEQLVKRYSKIINDRKAQIKKLSRYRNKIPSEKISRILEKESHDNFANGLNLSCSNPFDLTCSFNLSCLNGTMGFVSSSPSGTPNFFIVNAVNSLGDINDDGIEDIILGATIGPTQIIFGSSNIGEDGLLDISQLNRTNGFTFWTGSTSVSGAKDINADGIDDFLVGVGQYTYIVFGNGSIGQGGRVYPSSLTGMTGFNISVESSDSFTSVNYCGDVNADSYDDIILTAYSATYVIFGKPGIGNNGTLALSSLNGSNGFVIFDGFAHIASYAGDINADGIDDFFTPFYVIFGAINLGQSGIIKISDLNGKNGFVINVGDYISDLNYAGDVNGDGVDDIILGSLDDNNSTGASYVVFGRKNIGDNGNLILNNLNGINGLKLYGTKDGERSGSTVSGVGDINQDGIDDFMIGTAIWGNYDYAYVIFGDYFISNSGVFYLSNLNGKNGFILYNKETAPGSYLVSRAGDINNDSVNDILIAVAGDGNSIIYMVLGNKQLSNCKQESKNTLSNLIMGLIIGGSSLPILLYCVYKAKKKSYKNNLTDQKSLSSSQTQEWPESKEVVADTETFTQQEPISLSTVSYQSLPCEPVGTSASSISSSSSPSRKSARSVVASSPLLSPVADLKSPASSKTPVIDESGEVKVSFGIKFAELKYSKNDKLGKGAYGTVYKGTYNYNEVAIKKLHPTHLSLDALTEFKQEVGIMAKMRSNYIVPLMGVCLEAPNYCLVMELMPKGSLHDFLQNSSDLPQAIIYRIALDVTYGLLHLHQAHIIHRDLKTLNVLLDGELRAKVTDFGLSKMKSETSSSGSMKKVSGTLAWMAPELFDEKASATQAADIYALGMVLWGLIVKPYTTPFKGLAINALIAAKLARGLEQEKIPTHCPSQYAQLIRSCWKKPTQRPDAQKIADNLYALFTGVQSQQSPLKLGLPPSASMTSQVPDYASNPLSTT